MYHIWPPDAAFTTLYNAPVIFIHSPMPSQCRESTGVVILCLNSRGLLRFHIYPILSFIFHCLQRGWGSRGEGGAYWSYCVKEVKLIKLNVLGKTFSRGHFVFFPLRNYGLTLHGCWLGSSLTALSTLMSSLSAQQTHIASTSLLCHCNVVTLQRCCNNAVTTLCVCWEFTL